MSFLFTTSWTLVMPKNFKSQSLQDMCVSALDPAKSSLDKEENFPFSNKLGYSF